MSLVGNLEDLSLGDILQIISLSQKSGVLALASDHGSGRIVFRSGLVQAACLKGGASDLRQLLVGGGFIDPAGYDASLARSRDLGVDVEETLASDAGLSAERIDALIKESVEAAILEMFTWPAGDFSFDVRSELDPEDPHLVMPNGLNAQYLAMEGLRLCDERARDQAGEGAAEAAEAPPEAMEDPLFGPDLLEGESLPGEDELLLDAEPHVSGVLLPLESSLEENAVDALVFDSLGTSAADPTVRAEAAAIAPPLLDDMSDIISTEAPTAADTVVARVIERADPMSAAEDGPGLPGTPLAGKPETVLPAAETPTDEETTPARRATDSNYSAPVPSAQKMPVVLIDPDVVVLEWVKSAIEGDFARVHVFQQAEQGLARIRQYLIRGEIPLVLVSPDTQIDPLSGIHGLGDFVKRLKAQSSKLVVLGLRDDEDAAPSAMPVVLDGVLRRPGRRVLAERSGSDGKQASQVLARALLEILGAQHAPVSAPAQRPPRPQPQQETGLRVLRDTTAKLQDASSRGEILPVVLDFAADLFSRVAILIVRDRDVFVIAGRGIPRLEVDPLSADPSVALESVGPGWVQDVVASGRSFVATPGTPSDEALLAELGEERPGSVYLSPIESGGSVIALLFADQGAAGAAMPDTSGLEVVLHHAGLALDRAALERALWEADAETR